MASRMSRNKMNPAVASLEDFANRIPAPRQTTLGSFSPAFDASRIKQCFFTRRIPVQAQPQPQSAQPVLIKHSPKAVRVPTATQAPALACATQPATF
jgi:hypothetical protein